MKKSVLLSAIIGLSYLATAQITVPQEQKSLYGVVEATWCGNCGRYGLPVTNNVINQTSSKAIFLGLHKSTNSVLYSSTAADIANAIGTSGQPFWTLNGTPYGSYSGSLENTIITDINNTYSPTGADVNVGYDWSIANDTIYVETLTKFFNAQNGDYYLAIYVVEDNIFAYQANYDPMIPNGNIYHNHILRTSFSANSFGTMVASGAINTNATFSNTHKLKLDPTWDSNQIHLALVIWKDNGSGYDFVNVNGEEANASGITENTNQFQIDVYPNPTNNVFNIRANTSADLTINIFDLAGKSVLSTNSPSNNGSLHTVNVNELSSGVYFVNVSNKEIDITKKLIIE